MTVQLETSPSSHRVLSAYRELPAISGRSFLPISFLGRLPTTMAPASIVTFVAASTGSFAAAGMAATATAAGSAFGGPLMGLLADRRGQRPVLSVAVLVNALALLTLALGPALSRTGVLALCALIGVSMPQIGGMARARWMALTRAHAGTAMAFEGTADEAAYVLGPALAGVIAATAGSSCALVAAALAAVLAAGGFAFHPTHAVTLRTARAAGGASGAMGDDEGAGTARLLPLVLVPVLAMVLMGAFFSATQNGLTAYAASIGQPSSGGLIYALMAVGSASTALAMAAVPARIGAGTRCTVAAGGLLLGVLAMMAAGSTLVLCAAVLFTGLSVGPMLVTLTHLVAALAPVRRTATAMAYLSAGVVIGIAAGATTAGTLADAYGSLGALAIAAVAAALLLVIPPFLPRTV